MSIEELLDSLPDKIVLPNNNPIDEFDKELWYCFRLYKEGTEYELVYYCWLNDKELISFEGSLRFVAEHMYQWCVDNGYSTK